jgi:hypothetical protein
MAVTIPPWLNIDPVEPARIKLQANAQRRTAAAAELQAQIARERMQAEQQMQAQQIAAQERAGLRHDEVLRQTRDAELAQAAQGLQLRREGQAMQADRFSQQLRLKQQAAEQEAAVAAKQMQGLQAIQKDLQAGVPLNKTVAENASNLFAGSKPKDTVAALRGVAPPEFGTTPGGAEFVQGNVHFPPNMPDQGEGPVKSRPLVDAQGNVLANLYKGARGYVAAPRQGVSVTDHIKILQTKIALKQSDLSYVSRKSEEGKKLLAERQKLEDELDKYTKMEATATPAAPPAEAVGPEALQPGAAQEGPSPEPMPDQSEEE